VLIAGFDDIPTHRFEVAFVFDDCIGGYSLEGPLAGEYGEPELDMVLGHAPKEAGQG
jgi:hypothetical protein